MEDILSVIIGEIMLKRLEVADTRKEVSVNDSSLFG